MAEKVGRTHDCLTRKSKKPSFRTNKSETSLPNTEHLNQEAQEIYINNAGMVICAPYIPQLFQVLGLTKSNEFTSDLSMTKALDARTLLGYWRSGGSQRTSTAINQIAVWCAHQHNFYHRYHPSEKEQMRANELLKAVINNWSKIGNMLVLKVFQNAFLQREGKLSMQRQQWRLQVEQRPHDLILQTLPWNIRMIKTSLMQEIINVEWPY